MSWATAFVVYFLIWWTVLFTVLPFGVRPDPDGELEAGGWRGAPTRPRIGFKMLVTTLVSAGFFVLAYAFITSDWLSFRADWLAFQPLPAK